jgi:surface antigen
MPENRCALTLLAVSVPSRPYSRSDRAGLRRRVASFAAAAALALQAGACSTTYHLGSMFGKDKAEESGERTASVPTAAAARRSGDVPAEVDLAYAKAAAAEVLTRGGADVSQPWENPRSGARGTVTPIATAYAQDGLTCRNFLASYVRGDKESWLQGDACRKGSRWEVRDLRPLQRT